jgi:3-deoxy-D-manno-octulosonate 8-phosphate phosphatase (KDO 8-P phosphatase)
MLKDLKNITTFIFDIDGVLTDATIVASDSGELLRTFNIKDGYALQLAVKKGYHVCIISGGSGQAMHRRFSGLGIKDIFLGVGDKVAVYQDYLRQNHLESRQVLYMGDDMPDYEVMQLAGIAACPADAADEIKQIAHYISPRKGGETAARDVIEKVLKVQQNWFDINPNASDSGK